MTQEQVVERRVAALEELLGDPEASGNPFGHRALRAADEQGAPDPRAARELLRFGFATELVPEELGGRLTRWDGLVRMARVLFRRDTPLGTAHAAASLPGAVTVWAAGAPGQRRRAAELLLRGGTLAAAHQELPYGGELLRGEYDAVPYGGGFLLDGVKPAVAHAAQADALVVFGRTSPDQGGHSHSALLVDLAGADADRVRLMPRDPGAVGDGHRRGLEFHDLPVPGDALLGGAGDGTPLALRCLQVTRSLVPGMVLGGADTALRTAVECGLQHPSYGGAPLEHPHHRAAVARAFVTLLVCDCLALVAARALHLLPEHSSLPTAVTEYLVPGLLQETVQNLAPVLGARFHADEGGYGVLRRYLRDLPRAGLGRAGAAAGLAAMLPQFPRLAGDAWLRGPGAPAALFTDGPLPPADLGRLALTAGADPLAGTLCEAVRACGSWQGPPGVGPAALEPLRELAQGLQDELRGLREDCRALPPGEPAALATPPMYALADRYALVTAGAACLGVWQAHSGDPDSFLAQPAWVTEALMGLTQRLGRPLPARRTPTTEGVLREVLDRYHSGRTYDLYASGMATGEGVGT
ncbi:Acyl-CoA dehydrogenase [Streptomyces misionensis]|uniref:Acyl-CoA dehydrogenase n=1 Tax=Streptomyces misionensis TaxID=67331 RepID=A0A1H4IBS0_9ACTN|nr:acyl-CoA dehydrogenase family protein [Streptomyces misionensis]SEB31166.1 Acyl-CoA dehydrogenase [Streptomyces misionensis]